MSWWSGKGGQRVVIQNGQKVCYEGRIDTASDYLSPDGVFKRVMISGYWGSILNRRWHKIWADDRLTDDVWVFDPSTAGADRVSVDRGSDLEPRLRFTPKAEAWNSSQRASLIYSAPRDDTVKRITFDYDLQEGAQQWELRLTFPTSPGSFRADS